MQDRPAQISPCNNGAYKTRSGKVGIAKVYLIKVNLAHPCAIQVGRLQRYLCQFCSNHICVAKIKPAQVTHTERVMDKFGASQIDLNPGIILPPLIPCLYTLFELCEMLGVSHWGI